MWAGRHKRPMGSRAQLPGYHCYAILPEKQYSIGGYFMTEDTANMHNPFIIGDRLYLRPLEPALDNHLYATWRNDEELRRWFSIYPSSDARGKERLENLYRDFKHIILGVALKS